jgi:hypothetical protein
MSKTNVPARTVTYCDVCSVECAAQNQRHGGKMHLQRHGLDFQGNAVGSNDVDLDLCDSCLDKVVRAINGVKEPKQ